MLDAVEKHHGGESLPLFSTLDYPHKALVVQSGVGYSSQQLFSGTLLNMLRVNPIHSNRVIQASVAEIREGNVCEYRSTIPSWILNPDDNV